MDRFIIFGSAQTAAVCLAAGVSVGGIAVAQAVPVDPLNPAGPAFIAAPYSDLACMVFLAAGCTVREGAVDGPMWVAPAEVD